MEIVVLVTNRFWENLKAGYLVQKAGSIPFSGIKVIENNEIDDPPGYQFCYYHSQAYIPIKDCVLDAIFTIPIEDEDRCQR